MAKDLSYTNGVIAAKDKYLLKDKVLRLCELNNEDAFKLLQDSGYGAGAEAVSSPYDFEKMVRFEEEKLDEFIYEYAPNKAYLQYLLLSRDYHNVKAVLKARHLGVDYQTMLSSCGQYSIDMIVDCFDKNDFSKLSKELQKAIKDVNALLEDEKADVSGAAIGWVFEKAYFEELVLVTKHDADLRKIAMLKADHLNLLTAFRSCGQEDAKNWFVKGGKIDEKKLAIVLEGDLDKIEKAFKMTPYKEFVLMCVEDKKERRPYTDAEKYYASIEINLLNKKQYDLVGKQPFLFYVFRRQVENANVRIIFVCLNANRTESDIKKRLRSF